MDEGANWKADTVLQQDKLANLKKTSPDCKAIGGCFGAK